MQQRQLRLGDILDDYCPRERRVTNHAVVAMVGDDVKQTRCTTCDAEHEYKHAKVPRQRKKSDNPAALYAQIATSAPKRVAHDSMPNGSEDSALQPTGESDPEVQRADESGDADHVDPHESSHQQPEPVPASEAREVAAENEGVEGAVHREDEEGPVHRPLIRASLPRPEGQQPPQRPFPEFTIRQPGGRQNRFRPRHQRGGPFQGHQGHQGHQGQHGQQGRQGQQGRHFQGNRANGNTGGPMRGPHPNAGRPGMMKRHGPPGRKRSK